MILLNFFLAMLLLAQETTVEDDAKAETEQIAVEDKAAAEETDEAVVMTPRAELVRRFEGCGSPVNSVAFSPDGKYMLKECYPFERSENSAFFHVFFTSLSRTP